MVYELWLILKVEEETGFDMSGYIKPDDFIKTQVSTQDITMFIAKGIDEATVFETQTRKEIGAIEWVPLVDLPTWVFKKGPKRTGGKKQKRFYNVTPFVGPLKKWMQKNGINPNPPRKRGKDGNGAARERDLQPYTFNDSPQDRPLEPFSFETQHHAPSTAIDHLFAKFVQKDQQADNVAALQSDTARTLDKMFCGLEVSPRSAEQHEHDRQDDMLSQLLSNVGTVSAQKAPPPANEKQTKLLSLLNTVPIATPPTPPQTSHQSHLLSMLASPGSAPPMMSHASPRNQTADERADRHRALLESTLGGLAPPTPVKGGHGIASPGQMMSPMPQLPPTSHSQGWQGGYINGHVSPLAQPQHQSPHLVGQQQPPPQFPPSPLHYPGQPQAIHPPPVNDHQRNLLGALFATNGGQQQPQMNPPILAAAPSGPQIRPPNGPPVAMHPPYPMQPPQFSPTQAGHVMRPPAGLAGLVHQPGQGTMPFPAPPGPPGGWQGPRPPYGQPPPGYGGPPPVHQYGPPPGAYQPPPPPPNHLQQLQSPPNQPQGQAQPPHPAQSPPMHQPVARPPVGGPLLSLAAGH